MDDHKPAAAVIVQPPFDEGPLLSEVIKAYAAEKQHGWTEKSGSEIAADSLGLFKEIVGDVPIQKIDRKMVSNFKHVLVRLPPNRNKTKKYRDKSIPELLEMESEIEKVFAPRTVNKHLSRVGTFFNYAGLHGDYIGNNPATCMEIPLDPDADDKRAPYSINDLTNIFKVDGYANDNFSSSYMFWTPVIALFHGMRQSEIAQLHLSDIKKVKDGTWVFDVNDLEDKKVKNRSSKRLVPIHPFVKDTLNLVGLKQKLEHDGLDRLFPEIKPTRDGYGAPVSKWYNERFKHTVALEQDSRDRWKDFHSFRKTFITHVAHKDVPDKKIKQVVGHSTGSDVLNRAYIDRFKGKQLLEEVIDKIDFHKTIDLSHLKKSRWVVK
jgi:integrase